MRAEVGLDQLELDLGAVRLLVVDLGAASRRDAMARLLPGLLGRAGLTAATLGRTAAGQPVLTAPPGRSAPAVSISHSATVTGIAVGPAGPLGLDIERLRPLPGASAVARRRFTAEERAEIARAADPDAAFLRIWTCKEAVAKSVGLGLPAALGVRVQPTAPDGLRAVSHPERSVNSLRVDLAHRVVICAVATADSPAA